MAAEAGWRRSTTLAHPPHQLHGCRRAHIKARRRSPPIWRARTIRPRKILRQGEHGGWSKIGHAERDCRFVVVCRTAVAAVSRKVKFLVVGNLLK
jgi:hypothetical protein